MACYNRSIISNMTRDRKRANSIHFDQTHSGRKLKWVGPIVIKAKSSLHGLWFKIDQNIKNTIYVYLSPIIFYHMLKASTQNHLIIPLEMKGVISFPV